VKALSIKNPWAWWIVHGGKDVENRTWKTNYRGRLLIHVSSRLDNSAFYNYPIFYSSQYPHYEYKKHCGMIIGTVELYDCIENSESKWAEPDMWHWLLRNPISFEKPIPAKGKLGLWDCNEADCL
jgi:hypothetical protein